MFRSSLLVIFVCMLGSLSAQHFDIRAYGGFNVVQLTSDQDAQLIDDVLHQRSVTGRPGVEFGAAVTFGDRFFVQPGLQYSVATTEIVNKNTVTGAELKDETKLNILSVPLKVGFRLIDPDTENMFNVRIFGGFDGHHVLSVDHSTKSDAEGDINADDYQSLIVNADFGMGVDVLFLFLDLGYQLGLTPVHGSGDDAKANAFYVNLGVRFGS